MQDIEYLAQLSPMDIVHRQARDAAETDLKSMVYIRRVKAADIIDDLVDEEGNPPKINLNDILYTLHAHDGARLAIMSDRDVAIAAAKQNNKTPVCVM